MQMVHVPAGGPRVVLVHGASGCGASWDRVAWAWADLWVADLAGRGAAAEERPLHTVADLADDLRAALPDGPLWLVGHSLGGGIALQLVLDHPELWASAGGPVAGVVLLGSSARLAVSPAILEAVRGSTPAAPFRLGFAFALGTDAAARTRYDALTAEVSPVASLADWTACNGFDVRARLGEVGGPVLVVYGDGDVLTPPKHQVRLVDALPEATPVVLPGLGHMAPFEDAGAVAEAVRAWVAP